VCFVVGFVNADCDWNGFQACITPKPTWSVSQRISVRVSRIVIGGSAEGRGGFIGLLALTVSAATSLLEIFLSWGDAGFFVTFISEDYSRRSDAASSFSFLPFFPLFLLFPLSFLILYPPFHSFTPFSFSFLFPLLLTAKRPPKYSYRESRRAPWDPSGSGRSPVAKRFWCIL